MFNNNDYDETNEIIKLLKKFCNENNIILLKSKKYKHYILPEDNDKKFQLLEKIIEVYNCESATLGMKENYIHYLFAEFGCLDTRMHKN